MNLTFLLAQAAHGGPAKDGLWDPALRGILVVSLGVVLFCGSIYLLLGTNVGARLGFLVAFAGFSGFMAIISLFWATTATPLNSLHGEVPHWEVTEVLGSPSESTYAEIRDMKPDNKPVTTEKESEIRAAVDTALAPAEKQTGESEEAFEKRTELQKFQKPNEFVTTGKTVQFGGGKSGLIKKRPLFAVMTVQNAAQKMNILSEAEFTKEPDPTKPTMTVVLVRNLGSMRLPPILTFLASLLAFGVTLLALRWHELDRREAGTDAGDSAGQLAPAPA